MPRISWNGLQIFIHLIRAGITIGFVMAGFENSEYNDLEQIPPGIFYNA